MKNNNTLQLETQGYQLIKDYKHNATLRRSFNQLADTTFEIQFEEFYLQGGWNEHYICYSYLFENAVVSNVSLSTMELIINSVKHPAIQFGTVMTDVNHRRKGLALDLMQRVIADYKDSCDFFFLAADEEAVPLYEKCGFKPYEEMSFSLDVKSSLQDYSGTDLSNSPCLPPSNLRSVQMPKDTLLQLKAASAPISSTLSAINDEGILTFYYLLLHKDNFYCLYDANNNPMFYVLLSIDKDNAELIDIYKPTPLSEADYLHLLSHLYAFGIKTLHLHYTPDIAIAGLIRQPLIEGGWMILSHKDITFPPHAFYPRISKT